MTGQAGLKAGGIGAAVLLVLSLLGLISLIPGVGGFLGCACCGIQLLAYLGIGALGGFFLTPPRQAGPGAGAGAIAGLISGLAAALFGIIRSIIQMLVAGSEQMMTYIDPATMQQLIDAGIDPEMFAFLSGWGGVFLGGGLCCIFWLALGAGLGALGGVIFAAAKPD